ncbi:hypothetical protein D3C80_1386820 [compost metagenome]
MQHVGQAFALAQVVVAAAGVDQQAVVERLAELAQGRCGGVDHEQAHALAMQGGGGGEQAGAVVMLGDVEAVGVLEKAPGAVAVGDRQFGAAPAGVRGFGDDIGQQRPGFRDIGQVGDAHLQLGWRAVGLARGRITEADGDTEQEMTTDLAHGQLLCRCRQHRNSGRAGKYA